MDDLKKTYEFDDVLIPPIPSSVDSRDDVDISVTLPNGTLLNFPLIASPMVGVVDGRFAHTLSKLGGLAIMHRFYKSRKALLKDVKNLVWGDTFGLSVRVGEENVEELMDWNPEIILVDTANGYTKAVLNYCEKLATILAKRSSQKIMLMAGNVCEAEGTRNLINAGCTLIRVGIGTGSPCSTRKVTGIGFPAISALDECMEAFSGTGNYALVMDGGIRNSGDFVKAVVAGADLGMSGKLFAECYEAPNDGAYYGMASRTHMQDKHVKIKSVEGVDLDIVKKHSLKKFIREFGYGVKSAGTYLDAKDLSDIYCNGSFIEVSSNAVK